MARRFVLHPACSADWWQPLRALDAALVARDAEGCVDAYSVLLSALVARPTADLYSAVAEDLLWGETAVSGTVLKHGSLPEGLRAAALHDIGRTQAVLRRDWQDEVGQVVGTSVPPLERLAHDIDPSVRELTDVLRRGEPAEVLSWLMGTYVRHGSGILARFRAFRWSKGQLEGLVYPAETEVEQLIAVDRQIASLQENTERFLKRAPAHNTLLYGPRGSGKSTAVRGLLKLYWGEGLRLVEISVGDLIDLPLIVEQLRVQPHRFILFVDDLSFELSDHRYQPLKTLLEGSLTARPNNLLVYATSNRRHLVMERFSERPDPLDDDVHSWDTQNERLALADRFGLTITFPTATQQRFSLIVEELARREGLADRGLLERAVEYARWGNGLSGRTAQQFIDSVKAENS
ncbi:MAG: ATP-binding protein [Trueperaceae bacterium]|nr:MAG: ATP-binding protein [Trueperaceae bacterium]